MKKLFLTFAIAIIFALVMTSDVDNTEAVVATSTPASNDFIVLMPQISPYNYNINVDNGFVTVNFLSSFFAEGFVMVVDKETGIDHSFAEFSVATYHTVEMYLPEGEYYVMPYVTANGKNITGMTSTVIVD